MIKVNIHEAKTKLSQLITRALNGEEIIIAKSGKPVVKLVSIIKVQRKRKLGTAKGLIEFRDDFDASLPEEVLKDFEN